MSENLLIDIDLNGGVSGALCFFSQMLLSGNDLCFAVRCSLLGFIICLATNAWQQCCQPTTNGIWLGSHKTMSKKAKEETRNKKKTKTKKTNRFKLGRSTFECNCYLWAAATNHNNNSNNNRLHSLAWLIIVAIMLVLFSFLGTRYKAPNTHTLDSMVL